MRQIKARDWYTARQVADLLDGEVTEATVKKYCKTGKVEAKKVGPHQRWMVRGASILKLRQEWEID